MRVTTGYCWRKDIDAAALTVFEVKKETPADIANFTLEEQGNATILGTLDHRVTVVNIRGPDAQATGIFAIKKLGNDRWAVHLAWLCLFPTATNKKGAHLDAI